MTDGSARAQLGDPVEEGGVSPAPQVPVGVSSPTESLVATGFHTSYIPSATAGPRMDIPGSESGRVWVGGRQGPSLVGDGGLPCPFWDFSGRVGRRAITLRTHTQFVGCVSCVPCSVPPGGPIGSESVARRRATRIVSSRSALSLSLLLPWLASVRHCVPGSLFRRIPLGTYN